MRRLRLLPLYITSFILLLSSCQKETLPDTKKITYRVQGSNYDVTYTRADGVNETMYNRTGVFKQEVFAHVGEPVLLLARGSDDLNVRIVLGHGMDTVRTSKETGSSLVMIEMVVEDDSE